MFDAKRLIHHRILGYFARTGERRHVAWQEYYLSRDGKVCCCAAEQGMAWEREIIVPVAEKDVFTGLYMIA